MSAPSRSLTSQMTIALSLLLLAVACESSSSPRNDAPTVQITEPAGVLTVPESTAVIFKGAATDAEDGALSGASLEWTSNLDGPLGTGDSIRISDLSAGNHVVAFTATDSKGLAASATVPVTVTPFAPGNQPPQVTHYQPGAGHQRHRGRRGHAHRQRDRSGGWSPHRGRADLVQLPRRSARQRIAAHRDDALGRPAHDHPARHRQRRRSHRREHHPHGHPAGSGAGPRHRGHGPQHARCSSPPPRATPPGSSSWRRSGAIRIIKNGTLLSTPFLDLSALDHQAAASRACWGWPSIPTTPAAAGSTCATHPGGGTAGHSVIARYHVSSGNPDVADPAAQRHHHGEPAVHQPQRRHASPSGPMATSTSAWATAAAAATRRRHGQDRTDLLGSMLRLDVSGNGTYTIPASNPYAGKPHLPRGAVELRAAQSRGAGASTAQTGDLYIADVGQDALRGSRRRSRRRAAAARTTAGTTWRAPTATEDASCSPTGLTLPVLDYSHGEGCSVTGGYVYRGSAIPSSSGPLPLRRLLRGWVRSFRWPGRRQPPSRQDRAELAPGGTSPASARTRRRAVHPDRERVGCRIVAR